MSRKTRREQYAKWNERAKIWIHPYRGRASGFNGGVNKGHAWKKNPVNRSELKWMCLQGGPASRKEGLLHKSIFVAKKQPKPWNYSKVTSCGQFVKYYDERKKAYKKIQIIKKENIDLSVWSLTLRGYPFGDRKHEHLCCKHCQGYGSTYGHYYDECHNLQLGSIFCPRCEGNGYSDFVVAL